MGDWYYEPDPDDPTGATGRWRHDPDAPTPGPTPPPTEMLPIIPSPTPRLLDVPPRIDDWCEDRAPHELTDDDGRD